MSLIDGSHMRIQELDVPTIKQVKKLCQGLGRQELLQACFSQGDPKDFHYIKDSISPKCPQVQVTHVSCGCDLSRDVVEVACQCVPVKESPRDGPLTVPSTLVKECPSEGPSTVRMLTCRGGGCTTMCTHSF